MPATQKLRAPLSVLAVLLALILGAPAAHAADARFEGVSSDGKIAFFSTTEKLVSGDTDNRTDVYVRYFDEAVGETGEFVTRIVSLGPTGGNNAFDASFEGVSADGRRVFFSTRERLTAGDTDNFTDVYMRDLETKTTSLVSGDANGSFDANFAGMSSDGSRVFFSTKERLTGDDTDESFDVYVSEIGEAGVESIERVSQGATVCAPGCGNGGADANFLGASDDGTKAAFESSEPLAGQPDAKPRIYLRDMTNPSSELTRLVSPSGTCPEGKPAEECEPSFGAISADGSHVFFETSAQIAGTGDTDDFQDVYAWAGGTVTRASTGPDGGNAESNAIARFAGASPDGGAIYFESSEQLDPAADEDASQDIYERNLESGETTLVSQAEAACPSCGNGSFNASVVLQDNVPDGVATDGAITRVFFATKEKLTADDSDESFDVYARELPAGETFRVSRGAAACESSGCGNGPVDAGFSAFSIDGSRAFFVTDEDLDGQDLDGGAKDIYEHNLETGTTIRISKGETSICGTPPCDNGPNDAQLHGVSADGTVAFFVSEERLTADAAAVDDKVYSRSGTTTRLVSTGNPAGLQLGPPAPALSGTDPESPAASISPKVLGSAETGSFVKLYETADCSGEPVATGGAATLQAPGIGVSVNSGVTTSFRATAEADGFVSPCSSAISYKQHSEQSSGGGGGGGIGGGVPAPSGAPSVEGTGALDPFRYEAPQTRITFGPAFKTRIRRPVFRFADSTGQPGTTFVCKLDRRRWKSCGSPTKLPSVGRGKHVFQVKGINAVGVAEERPSKRAFKEVLR
jgi:Tol biopolymer transport system component